MRLPDDRTRRILIALIGLSMIAIAVYIAVYVLSGVIAGDEKRIELYVLLFAVPVAIWRFLRIARRMRLSGYRRYPRRND